MVGVHWLRIGLVLGPVDHPHSRPRNIPELNRVGLMLVILTAYGVTLFLPYIAGPHCDTNNHSKRQRHGRQMNGDISVYVPIIISSTTALRRNRFQTSLY